MNGNLLKENGEILRIAEKVKLYIPRFEHYEIVKDDKFPVKNCIIGYDGKKMPFAKKEITPTYIDDRMILDSLLSLNLKTLNNLSISRDRQEKEILKWCKKYGLPFQKGFECATLNSGSPAIQSIRENPYREQGFYAFNCEAFCIELARLYNVFMMMLAYKEDLYIGLDNEDRLDIHQKHIRHLKRTTSKEQIQKWLLEYFKEANFKMDIDFDGEKYSLIPTFSDLFELAKYQLLLLYNADTTTGVKTCKCCGALFSCTHRSQEFCGECSPQKYYAKKQSDKKRGVKNGNNK